MVAQKVMACKPAVAVRIVDMRQGLYSTSSSDGANWYETNVKARTCSCRATQSACKRGQCRHLVSARFWAKQLASMTPEGRAWWMAAKPMRINPDAIDVKALDLPLGALVTAKVLLFRQRRVASPAMVKPAPAAFSELFG